MPYLGRFWFSSYGAKSCQPVKLQNFLKCNISLKKSMMKFIFGMQTNIEDNYKLMISTWVCVARHTQSTQNKKFAYLCNISRKASEMQLIFCQEINRKVYYKLIVSLWVCVTRHAQSTQNNKFTISLQYLKENVKNKV